MKKLSRKRKSPLVDNVLLCASKKVRGRFLVWSLADPELKAEAVTLEQAEELLVEEMWNRYDLDEPFGIEYGQPNRMTIENGRALLEVTPNEVTSGSDPAQYFVRGFCPVCQSGKGGRNDRVLVLEHLPAKVMCGLIVRFHPYFKCGMRVGMCLYHKRICEEITTLCDPLVEFREVRVKAGKGCDFLEMVPKRIIPDEVPAARKGRIGGACVKCSARFIYARITRDHSGRFVRANNADLIRRHGVAAVGDESRPSICMTSGVWTRISKLEEARGLLTYEIGELTEDQISQRPKFERLTTFRA